MNAKGVGAPAQTQELVEILERGAAPDLELDLELRKTLVVRAGCSIRVFVPIKGRPTPAVTWAKDDGPVPRAVIDSTESFTMLIIPESSRIDAGKYVLTLENASGKKSADIHVRVLDSPGPPLNLKPVKIDKDSITLQWEMPLIDGGARITNYVIEKRESTRKAFATVITKCNTTSVRIGDLGEGCEYYFRVSAENDYGIGEAVETPDPIRASQAPTPPESIIPTEITKNTVSLAWTKPKHDGGSRITGYVLEAQKKGTDQWAHVTTVKAMDFTVKNLNENEEYIFHVMAVNLSGRSAPRESKAIVLRDSNSLPEFDLRGICQKTIIAKAGEDIKVEIPVMGRPRPTVTWQKDGAMLKLTQRTNAESTAATTILSINECNRDDSGVYAMTGKNIVGSVTDNIIVKVHDVPGPPKGPLKIVEVSRTHCVITWDPPTNDGGVPINNYVVEIRDTTSQTWTELSTNVIRTIFKAVRLTTGSEYQFRVKAKNRYGVGPHITSESVVAAYPFKVPGPPGTPGVVDSMVLMWQVPRSDGGSPITSYHIERKDRAGLRWVKCNKRKVKDLQFKATVLVAGHDYEFRVFAENAAGLSVPSVSSPFYKATDGLYKPGPPSNPRILDTSRSSITVAWNKPVYDGGCDITGYIVETCVPTEKMEDEEWAIVTPKECLLATSFTIVNLKEGQDYKIKISAVNSEGIGEAVSVPDTVKAEDRLLAPEIDLDAELRKVISIRACCSLRLFVPIRGRPTPQAKWTKDDGERVDRATIDSTTSYTSLVIENVNRFDSGKYNLTIENSSGSKTVSVQVRVLDTPSAPQNLKITTVTKEAVTLTWEPPANEGGVKVKNYIVEKRESTRKAYTTVNALCHQTTFMVTPLLEGCNYYFRVLAENEYGIGLPIETSESVKVSEKPQPPGKITLKDVTKNSVTLSWEKPEHDGGSRVVVNAGDSFKIDADVHGKPLPSIHWVKDEQELEYDGGSKVSGYVIESKELPEGRWTRCNFTNVPETHYEVTGLTEKSQYDF
uniref:Titin n=1 Tax=Cynoglossus semilaevis TaxID=244447 RepID=A0A3P8WBF9_CYNSE